MQQQELLEEITSYQKYQESSLTFLAKKCIV